MGKHRNQPAGRQPGDGKPGYKNIGKEHQWKKGGPSPNPAGRRAKKSPSLKDELHQILVEVLKSSISAGDRELTVMEAVLRRMMVAAVNDPKIAIRSDRYSRAAMVDLIGSSRSSRFLLTFNPYISAVPGIICQIPRALAVLVARYENALSINARYTISDGSFFSPNIPSIIGRYFIIR